MWAPNIRISSRPDALSEGLFGQVILYVFEVLPYLHARRVFPKWHITSKLYGSAPDFTVIPGIFDLAYEPGVKPSREVDLFGLHPLHASVLGGDWHGVHELWHAYFRVPERVVDAADDIDVGDRTLGLHYRGQDKNTEGWDTNSVSIDEFLTLACSFAASKEDLDSVFIATDEFAFVGAATAAFPNLRIINLGEVGFHKSPTSVAGRADRALLDCVLLSRCAHVIKCSSALSGFAKVLRPDLSIFRVSASKLFADIPYFPDAYIPMLSSSDPASSEILDRLLANDWLEQPGTRERFAKPFAHRPRMSRRQQLLWRLRRARHRIKRRWPSFP